MTEEKNDKTGQHQLKNLNQLETQYVTEATMNLSSLFAFDTQCRAVNVSDPGNLINRRIAWQSKLRTENLKHASFLSVSPPVPLSVL